MAHSSGALLGKPSYVWVRSCIPGTLCHFAPSGLAASCGVEISRLQRPSIRAGSHARHLILYASVDASRKAQRRRPHLYDGLLCRPGILPGRLHQHPDRGVTPHHPSAYPALSTAPAGITPVSRKRQSAMSNWAIPIFGTENRSKQFWAPNSAYKKSYTTRLGPTWRINGANPAA